MFYESNKRRKQKARQRNAIMLSLVLVQTLLTHHQREITVSQHASENCFYASKGESNKQNQIDDYDMITVMISKACYDISVSFGSVFAFALFITQNALSYHMKLHYLFYIEHIQCMFYYTVIQQIKILIICYLYVPLWISVLFLYVSFICFQFIILLD